MNRILYNVAPGRDNAYALPVVCLAVPYEPAEARWGDLALANGLLHIAIRDDLVDEAFINQRTEGFEEVRRTVASYWPDRVEQITGIASAKLETIAHLLGKAQSVMILTARGPEEQSKGVETVLSFINLVLALGKAGKPGSGFGRITGQGNGQGGRVIAKWRAAGIRN